jgi:hypothetical protein
MNHSIQEASILADPTEQLHERRSLFYLHHRASEEISVYFEEGFWRLSLQASQAEPCIHHALLAISSFYESHELCENPAVRPNSDRPEFLTKFALQQFTKAVGLLSRDTGIVSSNQQSVLLACLIFIWFELLQDNIDVALRHLRSGLCILARHLEEPVSHDIDSSMVRLFIRLHTEATLHGSSTADFDPNETVINVAHEALTGSASTNICGVQSDLDRLLNKAFRFHRKIERPGFVEIRLKNTPLRTSCPLKQCARCNLMD